MNHSPQQRRSQRKPSGLFVTESVEFGIFISIHWQAGFPCPVCTVQGTVCSYLGIRKGLLARAIRESLLLTAPADSPSPAPVMSGEPWDREQEWVCSELLKEAMGTPKGTRSKQHPKYALTQRPIFWHIHTHLITHAGKQCHVRAPELQTSHSSQENTGMSLAFENYKCAQVLVWLADWKILRVKIQIRII